MSEYYIQYEDGDVLFDITVDASCQLDALHKVFPDAGRVFPPESENHQVFTAVYPREEIVGTISQ
jgi:hypothetical protein